MDSISPILENPLLLAAILLFLAILPLALRQKKKSALDRAVERFEKEEQKAAAKGLPAENANKTQDTNKPDKPIALKDGSLVYRKNDQTDAPNTTDEFGGIPPFPEKEGENVKIVKPGVPISHFETAEPPPKKKVKLIKQEFSIAPDPSKRSSKKATLEASKAKPDPSPTDTQEPASSEDFSMPPINEMEETKDTWIEAEIPGLGFGPATDENSEDIPVFNAFPKKEYQPEKEEPEESLEEEKQAPEVKNIAPETEEKRDSKPEKTAPIEPPSPELEMESLESEPKEVEINAPVVSHKNITLKEDDTPETEDTEENKVEPKAIPLLEEEEEVSSETEKLKPFLLDIRYLDSDEEVLPSDRVDITIARLNALQADLENQFLSTPVIEQTTEEKPANENIRKDRTQNPLPEVEGMPQQSLEKKEVSLEELDSFLFTATQRKKKE